MKRITTLLGVALLTLGLGLNAVAAEVCPEDGKVESSVDGDLDNIVLDAGTLVCIKGGQDLVEVTADGESTLAELLGNGKNVSHYTVLASPSTTTTTTPETTTTQETTTTTISDEALVITPTTQPPEVRSLPHTGMEGALIPAGLLMLLIGSAMLASSRERE